MTKEKQNKAIWEKKFDKKFISYPGGIYIRGTENPATELELKSFIADIYEQGKREEREENKNNLPSEVETDKISDNTEDLEVPADDLAKKVREWHKSYEDRPPWSSVLGLVVREKKKERERIIKILEKIEAPDDSEYDLEAFHSGFFKALEEVIKKVN